MKVALQLLLVFTFGHWHTHAQDGSCCCLERPRNGGKIGDQATLGSIVQYECDDGYELVGSAQRQCQADGTWTGDAAFCLLLSCPAPGRIDNGGYTATGLTVGSEVNFFCNTGHQLAGSRVLGCTSDGTWDEPLPSCIVVDCGNPSHPENGGREGDVFTYTNHVTFSCGEGYRLLGSAVRFCLADGTWSGEPAVCNLGSCGDPGTPVSGTRTMSGTTVGDTVDWHCDQGHGMVGNPAAECQASGRWSRPTPTCNRVTCLHPGSPVNGERIGDDFNAGSFVSFMCNTGYMLQGSSSLDCLTTGLWSGTAPVCRALTCADPGRPENGYRNMDGNTLNSMTHFECNPGYSLNGPPRRACLPPSPGASVLQWDERVPECLPTKCVDPGTPLNGLRRGDNITFGSLIRFSCDSGFSLDGAAALICLYSGEWSQPLPICEPVRCPAPAEIPNGIALFSAVRYEAILTYICNPGYNLEGQASAACQADGRWSFSSPKCTQITCPVPSAPANGDYEVSGLLYQDTAMYSCDAGYEMQNRPDAIVTCRANGEWSHPEPTCESTACPDPGAPANGQRLIDDPQLGGSITFSCDEGYRLAGIEKAICLPNRRWSSSVPTCESQECPMVPAPLNGNMNMTSIQFLGEVQFACDAGFALVGTPTLTCLSSGEWSGGVPVCEEMLCLDPGQILNGQQVATDFSVGGQVEYQCDMGFTMNGPSVLTCKEGASPEWDLPKPTCDPDCLFGNWTVWEQCSATCGSGTQARIRTILQVPDGAGKACGQMTDTRSCNTHSCAITCDGQYEEDETVCRVRQVGLTPVTDVLVVVDESRSMEFEHAWLPGMLRSLEDSLTASGIGQGTSDRSQRNLYALVGFGKAPDATAHVHQSDCASPNGDLFPIECYPSANSKLEADPRGSIEDGYEAIQHALQNIPWRRGPGVAHNMIFISDEDRDAVASTSRADIKQLLQDNGFVLNVVIDNEFFDSNGDNLLGMAHTGAGFRGQPNGVFTEVSDVTVGNGYAKTKVDYTNLALELSGASWDINILRSGIQSASFTAAFTSVKTMEIQRQTDKPYVCTCTANATSPSGGMMSCREMTSMEACRCVANGGVFNEATQQCDGLCQPGARSGRLVEHKSAAAVDAVLVVDQSRSMGDEIEWLKTLIPILNSNLLTADIGSSPACPNRFAVVGFARRSPNETASLYRSASGSSLFSIREYPAAVALLSEDAQGRVEDGYQAMDYALENIPLRSTTADCAVARTMFLLTDEDRDAGRLGRDITISSIRSKLSTYQVQLNVIVDSIFTVDGAQGVGRTDSVGFRQSGDPNQCNVLSRSVRTRFAYGNTNRTYIDLALRLGGGAWDINLLRNASLRDTMTCSIVNLQVAEIPSQLQVCEICSCSVDHDEVCQPATSQAQSDECYCRYAGGTWVNGVCVDLQAGK
ncbi:sushi, von Willebrand factor type A, EGF and pentraxin domain-containing protein 1-like [Sycon ciliatum]|uniref:sushi, von Willebrand factor type A, EGF and pentraxin domain-containing protein 1-like n=1 Tax=Sycon ciliatum TaxID=27933 RepID=UPI0031F65CD9